MPLRPKRVVFDPDGPTTARGVCGAGDLRWCARPAVAHLRPAPMLHNTPSPKLFSPVRAPLPKPSDLSAETALLWGLRDARFAYRIGPRTRGSPRRAFAGAASACTGARYPPFGGAVRRVAAGRDRALPRLLAQPFVTTLGVSPALRDLLRRTPTGPMPELRDWWRGVDEPFDWTAWQGSSRRTGSASLPASNLLVDAASGGALLVSARRPGFAERVRRAVARRPLHYFRTSAPGSRGWRVPASSIPAWSRIRRPRAGFCWRGERPSTCTAARSSLAGRGRIFPEDDVVECVTQIPRVDGACVVPVATSDSSTPWAFVLVVFGRGARGVPLRDNVVGSRPCGARWSTPSALASVTTSFPIASSTFRSMREGRIGKWIWLGAVANTGRASCSERRLCPSFNASARCALP